MPSSQQPLELGRLSSDASVSPIPAQATTRRPKIQRLRVGFGRSEGARGPPFFLVVGRSCNPRQCCAIWSNFSGSYREPRRSLILWNSIRDNGCCCQHRCQTYSFLWSAVWMVSRWTGCRRDRISNKPLDKHCTACFSVESIEGIDIYSGQRPAPRALHKDDWGIW